MVSAIRTRLAAACASICGVRVNRRSACAAMALCARVLLGAATAAAQSLPVTSLHRIDRVADGGDTPLLTQASDGNFYGVAIDRYDERGGSLFRMRPDGAFAVLHRFGVGVDGDQPSGALIQATDGQLYGMTRYGGKYGRGTVFRATLDGRVSLLYHFSGEPDGSTPAGALVQGRDGLLYGTTAGGGAANAGLAFRMTLAGALAPLHHFRRGLSGAWSPDYGLVELAGALYGLSWGGGTLSMGTVYRLTPDGALTVLHSLDRSDGDYSLVGVLGPMVKASDGNLYGSTPSSFKGLVGLFYRISPDGAFSILSQYRPSQLAPTAPLNEARTGSFFSPVGSLGVVRVTTGGTPTLVPFASPVEGSAARGPLVRGADGYFYGITDLAIYRFSGAAAPDRVRISPRRPVRLSWSPVPDAVAYTITRMANSGERVVIGRTADTSFVDATAAAGRHYEYAISTSTAFGESPFSRSVQVVVNRGVAGDVDSDGRADVTVYQPGTGDWWTVHSNGQPNDNVRWGVAGDIAAPGDFEGDGALDHTVFRPSTGTWFTRGIAAANFGRSGDVPVAADYDGDGRTDLAIYRPSSGVWAVRGQPEVVWGERTDLPVPADYNGDGVADIAVYRPSSGVWYIRGKTGVAYGDRGDIPVPADYNGDGVTDIAVFRPSTGMWFVKDQFATAWGAVGDVPVPLDRNGDGRAEIGVYRRGSGHWYFKDVLLDVSEVIRWGGTKGDVPIGRGMFPWHFLSNRVGRDFNGDGRDDVMVHRPSTGVWWMLASDGSGPRAFEWLGPAGTSMGQVPLTGDFNGNGVIDFAPFVPSTGRWWPRDSFSIVLGEQWGTPGDLPVPGDYNGDGATDLAVFRPSAGVWYIQDVGSYIFGGASDIPVPADYDGDGITDLAVYRAGDWFVRGGPALTFGVEGDIPVPADYDGDGITDVAVFRPSTATWYVRGQLALQWGARDDVPIPLDRDGDGRAELIVYRPSTGTWYSNNPATGAVESVVWGVPGDIPVGRGPYWTYR